MVIVTSGCFFKHEIYMESVKGKNNLAGLCFLQYPGIQQGMHVTIHRFYIPPQAAAQFTNGHRSCSGHDIQHFPSFAG